jgi:hypothetical protein
VCQWHAVQHPAQLYSYSRNLMPAQPRLRASRLSFGTDITARVHVLTAHTCLASGCGFSKQTADISRLMCLQGPPSLAASCASLCVQHCAKLMQDAAGRETTVLDIGCGTGGCCFELAAR